MVQFENYRINCEGSFDFHNQKDSGWDVQPTKNRHQQIIGQANQGEGKSKKVAIYYKIVPLEALIDQEGWKVSLLKKMYAIRLPTLI